MDTSNIPEELRARSNWVARVDKLPISPHNLYGAKANDPATWGTLDQAFSCVGKLSRSGKPINGIGFELRAPYCGIDIDHCIDAATGEISREALDIVEMMDSYTEYSPSRTGLHILYKNDGSTYPDRRKKKAIDATQNIEMYQSDRYFTVTGEIFGEYNQLNERTQNADIIYKAYMLDVTEDRQTADKNVSPVKHSDYPDAALTDNELLRKARSARNGAAFSRLWDGDTSDYDGDDSRADLALCDMLAFWTGCDAGKMDALFRQSGLMREKWDRKQSGTTYGAITIQKAISGCTETYSPSHNNPAFDFTVSSGAAADQHEVSVPALPKFTYEDIKSYKADDIGTAALFSTLVKGFVRYAYEEKSFYLYDGTRWRQDVVKENLEAGTLLMNFVAAAQKLIPPPPAGRPQDWPPEIAEQENINKAFRNQYHSLGNANGRERVMKDVKKHLKISRNAFDRQPYLLNCRNCTYNLDIGAAQPHNPADMITRIVNADYDPNAVNERFNHFIDEICEGSAEQKTALQTALGYALIGATPEECFFIAYGKSTRNGKGTLFDLVLDTLGDYGVQMDFYTIARSGTKDASRATPDLARLVGVRYVLVNEPQKGTCFDEGLTKQLTGSDNITARPLYGATIEFKPRFTIYITSNNLPSIADDTMFASDRVRIIPFNRHFTEEERDTSLKAKLREGNGRAAVLNWLIEGYRLYKEHGLQRTAPEETILRQYRDDNDYIAQFIGECLEPLNHNDRHAKKKRLTEIMARYADWCRFSNIKPLGKRMFKEELIKHGIPVFCSHKQDAAAVRILYPHENEP